VGFDTEIDDGSPVEPGRLRRRVAGSPKLVSAESNHLPLPDEYRMHFRWFFSTAVAVLVGYPAFHFALRGPAPLHVGDGYSLVLIGNNLCSRMMNFGHFETEVQLRYPDSRLTIRNMCESGETPGFRPHSGRNSHWAFPGAGRFQTVLDFNPDDSRIGDPEDWLNSGSEGHFETPDEWLTRLRADIVVAFFGYNESFGGEAGLENFKAELDAFVRHTSSQLYNGGTPPQLALVSPIAFEDLSGLYDVPDGRREDANLELYTRAMREVAGRHGVLFVDAFAPSKRWYARTAEPLTIDGFQLNETGYARFSSLIADRLFGGSTRRAEAHRTLVREAVLEKNWFWHKDYKIPNGVHVFGRRHKPFGPDNYPYELAKIREMTAIRDTAIWQALKGEPMDLAAADARTSPLPPVETNYVPQSGEVRYLYGEEALATFQVAPGYRIELFASEEDFPDLANPVQITFDNRGRLWVATMPTYPHWRPGDPRPNDKLVILEDTNGDGRADRQTVFADGLHIPVGFEITPDGVYVSQGKHLVLLTDTNGDDRADRREIVLSGFDDHDTHHTISAFVMDESGAIYMGEGVFLHSNIETAYGPVRGTNGGFFRYSPQRRHLERTAQLSIPNPWGIAFDDWGQNFFAETSSPDVRWMMPGTVKPRYGVATHKSFDLIEEAHRVRPTSGLEFVSSRHFPDEVQGDLLINNTIGFLGTKQHAWEEHGTGYRSFHRQDLLRSTDVNFRPVDMEFAPDGSLYIADWHNVLVGHMQHSARDPLRDHVHGRIYRITYPSRPLIEPAQVHGASIETLMENLKLHEYRTRYRTRRELRGRDASEVLPRLARWVERLDSSDPKYEHHLLEALWVTWGLNRIDDGLLRRLLGADDHRARAAAVRVLRYAGHQIADQPDLLAQAARDEHGRVRLEAIVAASWLDREQGMRILMEAAQMPLDEWTIHAHTTAVAHLNDEEVSTLADRTMATNLAGADLAVFQQGKLIYDREGSCITCHQPDGKGLPASGFPPLAGTRWVTGSEDRLIKLTLKGLHGPIEVLGQRYPGQVPMTPFEGLLNDEEIAAVLTYVRNAFGNQAPPIAPLRVREVRESIRDKRGFFSPEELLQLYPLESDSKTSRPQAP
jgi:mono/diheme cytochrome c family protein/glucose/arabinose dehydrogenase